ncbi:MAG: hypothetical protein IT425_04200 [Pirellulales bacterium]|nr:hypothetical protein [Pirellulales bacterium]
MKPFAFREVGSITTQFVCFVVDAFHAWQHHSTDYDATASEPSASEIVR